MSYEVSWRERFGRMAKYRNDVEAVVALLNRKGNIGGVQLSHPAHGAFMTFVANQPVKCVCVCGGRGGGGEGAGCCKGWLPPT